MTYQLVPEDELFQELYDAVLSLSKRGEWYDGPTSTSLWDWLREGDLDNMTPEELAAEWDE